MEARFGSGLIAGMALLPAGAPADEPRPAQAPISATPAKSDDRLAEAKRLMDVVARLHGEGRYSEAIPRARQVLQIRKAALGERHPDTAESLNNLAVLLKAQGDYAGFRQQRILSANSHRGPFGRKMGDMEHAGEANPGRQTPRPEFADSISRVAGKPRDFPAPSERDVRVAPHPAQAFTNAPRGTRPLCNGLHDTRLEPTDRTRDLLPCEGVPVGRTPGSRTSKHFCCRHLCLSP
jgi:hypothetical protein